MKAWTIGRKLYGGVGTLVFLLMASSALALVSAARIYADLEQTGGPTTKEMTLALQVSAQLEQSYSHAKSMTLYGVAKDAAKYKEFAGRSHFILGQPGWEEVADFALDWALTPRELDEP